MKLLRLAGVFGRLDGEELVFADGLNILHLPNEGGKSTWCALLRALLYGIDSRERDKGGRLADKNRYAPWSGKPMAGLLECEAAGRRLRITRGAKGRGVFELLAVEDLDTGLALPELMISTLGERLTGVSRAVFERTMFIPQGQMAVTADGDLEKRIASLVTGGEEDSSYSAAAEQLNKWSNRRGRSGSGLCSKLEEERRGLRQDLQSQREVLAELEESTLALRAAREREALLSQEAAAHRLRAQDALRQRAAEAKSAWERAQEQERELMQTAITPPPLDSLFDGAAAEQVSQQVERDARRLNELIEAIAAAKQQRAKRDAGKTRSLAGACACALLAALSFFAASSGILCGIFAAAAVVFLALFALSLRRPTDQSEAWERERDALLLRYGAQRPEDLHTRAAAYREALLGHEHEQTLHAERLRIARETASQREADYRALAAQLSDTPQTLEPQALVQLFDAPPLRAEGETAVLLTQARSERERYAQQVHTAEGKLAALRDPSSLAAREEELTAQLRARQEELAAIALAQEALAEANAALRARFSPAVNQRAGEIFSALTGGRYAAVALTSDFSAEALEAGELLPRGGAYLSAGTLDQLYLAVRLAICELTSAGEDAPPLVLDDALCSFDDQRLALTLDYLRGQKTQTLLFTCQQREARG